MLMTSLNIYLFQQTTKPVALQKAGKRAYSGAFKPIYDVTLQSFYSQVLMLFIARDSEVRERFILSCKVLHR